MTFEEFERLPDDESGKLELVDGEVISVPPAEIEAHEDHEAAFRGHQQCSVRSFS